MADRSISILTPATTIDLMTLAEARLMLGPMWASISDAAISFYITVGSDEVATLCNRTFAREMVADRWRWNGSSGTGAMPGYPSLGYPGVPSNAAKSPRIFLSHWPAAATDILSVESPAGNVLDPTAWELEPISGKLSYFGGWSEPAQVTYWGGYNLPDEAPPALKQAAFLLIRNYLLQQKFLGVTAGTRQVSHRESRVGYFDPNLMAKLLLGGKESPVMQSVMNLLSHYTRYEI